MKRFEAEKMLMDHSPLEMYRARFGDEWAAGLARMPEHMHYGVMMWVLFGQVPGNFLKAIINGDLYSAAWHADGTNQKLLFEWAIFFYNFAPAESKGAGALASWKGASFDPE